MARKLKVYGWTGYRLECPPAPNGNHQTREVVAAASMAAAARAAGERSPRQMDMCESGNDEDIAQAMSKPGVVFWRPLNKRDGSPWTEAKKR
jgi:hypothetical protein